MLGDSRVLASAACLALSWFMCAVAQQPDTPDPIDQQDERLMPDMGDELGSEPLQTLTTDNYRKYTFLNVKANHIALNGADWSRLGDMMRASGDTVVSIVHIGDSHIQAEGATTRTRSLLQHRYGSAGRGLITPLKLIGTNQPFDYHITSTSEFDKGWIMKAPWPVNMGFTGAALRPRSKDFFVTISVERRPGSEPDFDFVRMYGTGSVPTLKGVSAPDGREVLHNDFVRGDTMTVFLYEPSESVTLRFETTGQYAIHGFQLENQMTGVLYSAIGNNGATFSKYNELGSMGSDLRALRPQLVILSLGANEAFGKITDDEFYSQIHHLVTDIKKHNPQAQILLVTPQECQKASYVRRGKGKKRRRVKTYAVNTRVRALRDVLLRYGRDHSVATYDWYEVAGGKDSSSKWIGKSLMKNDRIHNTWDGYELQGSLLYDALIEIMDKPRAVNAEPNTEERE